MWDEGDPDAETFKALYELQETGVDVDDQLESLQARREPEKAAEDEIVERLSDDFPEPRTVVVCTSAATLHERLKATQRVWRQDPRTGDLVRLNDRRS